MRNSTPSFVGKIPLYGAPSVKMGNGHAGLYFNKFCKVLDPAKAGDKSDWLKDFVKNMPHVGDAELIREFVARREKLIAQFQGLPVRMETAERFVTGLGYRHPLENGFSWHAVLGTPYLAGSGLKGLARAWASFLGVEPPTMDRVFGPRGAGKEPGAGSVIFLEAIPCAPVKLVAEVMTPHYGPHYRGEAPPGDYHAPVPIPFLAVEKGAKFLAGVLPRKPEEAQAAEDAKRAHDWLLEALEQMGAGAKTATGYGRFKVEKDATKSAGSEKNRAPAKPAEEVKPAAPTMLPAMFEVEFKDFAEARVARRKARERAKKGKAEKLREFELRPVDRALTNLAGTLLCSSRDTEGYDLPFEEAERRSVKSISFYMGNLEERDGKKVARKILLTMPKDSYTPEGMKLTRADFTNFTAFERVRIDACTGINVFLGPNGTGKSHAMKAMYALIKAVEGTERTIPIAMRFRVKLTDTFRPNKGSLSQLIRRSPEVHGGAIFLEGTSGNIEIKILPEEDALPEVVKDSWNSAKPSTFLPTNDILALSEGFIPAYKDGVISMDETYHDACLALQRNELKGEKLNAAQELVKPIEEAIGGPVKLDGQRFYVHGKNGPVVAHALAEGHRKLASLARLILNGSLSPDSILFWDEPETNLNPRLIGIIVDALLGLAKLGVQIFVTTHDYLLSNKLSLHAEYKTHPEVPIKFFAFYREGGDESKPVVIDEGATLADLSDNPILDEFVKHYDFEGNLFDKQREQP